MDCPVNNFLRSIIIDTNTTVKLRLNEVIKCLRNVTYICKINNAFENHVLQVVWSSLSFAKRCRLVVEFIIIFFFFFVTAYAAKDQLSNTHKIHIIFKTIKTPRRTKPFY